MLSLQGQEPVMKYRIEGNNIAPGMKYVAKVAPSTMKKRFIINLNETNERLMRLDFRSKDWENVIVIDSAVNDKN